MTINLPSLAIEPGDLDRFEELVRHLAAHDGRMPTEDTSLAWWLIDALDQPPRSPLRVLLEGVPTKNVARSITPSRADTWAKFVQRLDQLDHLDWQGKVMDDAEAGALSSWVEATIARYLSGSMKPAEELLLRKRKCWSFERPLSPKKRSDVTMMVGLRAIKDFHREYGHTDVPEDVVVEGVNLRLWWKSVRDRHAGGGMKPHDRQRLAALKLDLRSDSQIAKDKVREDRQAQAAERRAQGAAKHARDTENQRRAREGNLAAQRRTEAAIDATRVFAQQYGHTAIPVGATTEDGLTFGRIVDQWRAAHAKHTLSPKITNALQGIDRWTWRRTPASPEIQRPAPVLIPEVVPEDTTKMNRSGLRQFLPGD